MTLNQIIETIQEIGEKHHMIKKVHFGSVVTFLGKDNLYPAMNYDLLDARVNGSELSVRFTFFFFDRMLQEEENETEVLSDQLQIAQDIIAQLRYPGFDFSLSDVIPISFFTDNTPDVLAGVKADITINLGYVSDRCQVPTDYTYG